MSFAFLGKLTIKKVTPTCVVRKINVEDFLELERERDVRRESNEIFLLNLPVQTRINPHLRGALLL